MVNVNEAAEKIPTTTANDVATWFLARSEEEDAQISNLKIQKLLYYAQGHYLGQHGVPLFQDEIEAWSHGPVVPAIYRRFRDYGAAPIDADECIPDNFNWDTYRDVEEHLERVWATYGEIAAWVLRNRTHSEAPWVEAFNGAYTNSHIPHERMQAFFAATR